MECSFYNFAQLFLNKTFSAIPIACSSSHSAQNIALNELARQAIMADPVWDNGKYFLKNVQPKNGLAVARMVGHISYLSEKGMQEKFGRKFKKKQIMNLVLMQIFKLKVI